MSDVYRIGVLIDMSGRGLGILGAMSSSLSKLTGQVEGLSGKLTALRAAAGGAMGVIAGAGTLHVMERLVDHGAELVHQQNLLRRAGVDNQRIAEATAAAWAVTQQVPGTRVAQNLQMFGELRSQMSSEDQAQQFLPDLARMAMLMQNQTGKLPDRMAQTVMRVLEQRGQIFSADGHTMDPDKVRTEMSEMYQAMAASHGLISPETFLGFMQQAGPAGMAMSPEAFYRLMPTAMQTMGGHRSGTAMASLFAQMVGGVMTQRTATEMERLGLLNPEMTHVRRGGQVTVDPGAIQGFDPANPFAYFSGANSPYQRGVAAHGENGAATLEGMLDPKIVEELYRSLGRETTRRMVAEFIALAPTFERDQRLRQQTMTPDAAAAETSTDPTMAMTRFTSAWSNLQTALGAPLVLTSIGILDRFTDVLNRLAVWATANPQTVENIGLAVGALAGLVTIGGALTVATAALTILVGPVGLAALAAGIILLRDSLGPDNAIRQYIDHMMPTPEQMGGMFLRFSNSIVEAIWTVGEAIGQAARAMFDRVVAQVIAGLQGVGKAIVDWVTGLPGRIAAALAGAMGMGGGGEGAARPPMAPGGNFLLPSPSFIPQSYVPPPQTERPIEINVRGDVDGQTLLRFMTKGIARSGPSGGATGFDYRASPVSAVGAA